MHGLDLGTHACRHDYMPAGWPRGCLSGWLANQWSISPTCIRAWLPADEIVVWLRGLLVGQPSNNADRPQVVLRAVKETSKENGLAAFPLVRYCANMMIVLANTKGGVGKSTLAVHFAVWLHDQGKRVALIDADRQRSSSQWMAEAEPRITVVTVRTPDDCLTAAQELRTTHDVVIGDGPGGLDDLSRTLLLVADLAIFPISPSILDLRSVSQATEILRYAQRINGGRPIGRLILNKMRRRDKISHELANAAPELGLDVAHAMIRDLQAYRDAAQQGTVVTRMKRKGEASTEMDILCREIARGLEGCKYGDLVTTSSREVANG